MKELNIPHITLRRQPDGRFRLEPIAERDMHKKKNKPERNRDRDPMRLTLSPSKLLFRALMRD